MKDMSGCVQVRVFVARELRDELFYFELLALVDKYTHDCSAVLLRSRCRVVVVKPKVL